MPNVWRHDGWRFYFYYNQGDPREPAHVHVRKANGEAKFWLEPNVSLAESSGIDARSLRELLDLVEARHAMLLRSWNDYFT